jgi:serine/threonine protein phosphatase PrpC
MLHTVDVRRGLREGRSVREERSEQSGAQDSCLRSRRHLSPLFVRFARVSAMIPRIMAERATGGATLYLEAEMEEAEIRPCVAGEVAVVSARSPLGDGVNEDAAALIPLGSSRAVLAVADGVGGTRAGAAASSTALRCLERALLDADPEADLRGAILDGIERANRAVIDLGTGAATTLALVEVTTGALRPYHVGDSAILLVGQQGKVKLQTVSHSPVGYAVESGLIDQDEAMHHEDRHLISNMVGSADMRIEVGPTLRVAPRDTLLRHPSKPDDLTFVVFRPISRAKSKGPRDA